MEPIRVASFQESIELILRKCQYDDDDVLFAYVAKREGLSQGAVSPLPLLKPPQRQVETVGASKRPPPSSLR
jgi:hypothetical protein